MEDTYEAALDLLEQIGMASSTPEFVDLITAEGDTSTMTTGSDSPEAWSSGS